MLFRTLSFAFLVVACVTSNDEPIISALEPLSEYRYDSGGVSFLIPRAIVEGPHVVPMSKVLNHTDTTFYLQMSFVNTPTIHDGNGDLNIDRTELHKYNAVDSSKVDIGLFQGIRYAYTRNLDIQGKAIAVTGYWVVIPRNTLLFTFIFEVETRIFETEKTSVEKILQSIKLKG